MRHRFIKVESEKKEQGGQGIVSSQKIPYNGFKLTKGELNMFQFFESIENLEFEPQKRIFLEPAARSINENHPLLQHPIRKVWFTVDFYLPQVRDEVWYIDCKPNLWEFKKKNKHAVLKTSELKYTMFRHQLFREGKLNHRVIFVPSDKMDDFRLEFLAFFRGDLYVWEHHNIVYGLH